MTGVRGAAQGHFCAPFSVYRRVAGRRAVGAARTNFLQNLDSIEPFSQNLDSTRVAGKILILFGLYGTFASGPEILCVGLRYYNSREFLFYSLI